MNQLSWLVALLMVMPTAFASTAEEKTVDVELIATHTSVQPGQTAQLGLRLRHEPHWHTYWLNPGDSGIATSLAWTLPPGFSVGTIVWPRPSRFNVDGLYNFGFEGEMVLPVSIRVPDGAVPGIHRVSAVAKWLACREVCVPGKAEVALDLTVAASPPEIDARWNELFDSALTHQPKFVGWDAVVTDEAGDIVIRIGAEHVPETSELDAFIENRQVVSHAPPAITRDQRHLVVRFTRSEYFSTAPTELGLVLTEPATARAWRLVVPFATPKS